VERGEQPAFLAALCRAQKPASKDWAHGLVYMAGTIFSEATGRPASSDPSGPCGRFTIALFQELQGHLPKGYRLTDTAYREACRKIERLKEGA
jgi:hypothetical protein